MNARGGTSTTCCLAGQAAEGSRTLTEPSAVPPRPHLLHCGGVGRGAGAEPATLRPRAAASPAKEQLAGVSFCITSPPPWSEAIILGFQHIVVMLGTTAIKSSTLIPQMRGRESSGGSNNIVRTWHKHPVPDILQDSSSGSNGWLIYLSGTNHLHHLGLAVQQRSRPSREILADNEGNAGGSYHRIDDFDHAWFWWALA